VGVRGSSPLSSTSRNAVSGAGFLGVWRQPWRQPWRLWRQPARYFV